MKVLNASFTPVFPIEEDVEVAEETRLEYRYLDLRRKYIKNKLIARHKMPMAARNYMSSQEFLEIETPILIKNTPGGLPGICRAEPRQPGQVLRLAPKPPAIEAACMIAGLDKYYQIAKCFRDEDPRADRQPEFTQVDWEMSFIDEEDIYRVGEGLMKAIFKGALGEDLKTPFTV